MQRELSAGLGTVGATHVRFLFGFPFALVFLAGLLAVTGAPLPRPGLHFWPWVIGGALTQIAATALMLAAMGERSFVVTNRLYQNRTDPRGDIRLHLSWRRGDAADGGCNFGGNGWRDYHVDQIGQVGRNVGRD